GDHARFRPGQEEKWEVVPADQPGEAVGIFALVNAFIDQQGVAGLMPEDKAGLLEGVCRHGLPVLERSPAKQFQQGGTGGRIGCEQDAPLLKLSRHGPSPGYLYISAAAVTKAKRMLNVLPVWTDA